MINNTIELSTKIIKVPMKRNFLLSYAKELSKGERMVFILW